MKSSIKLWPQQRKALRFVQSRDAAAALCEQRTGKTFITLKHIEELMNPVFKGLLVCMLTNRDVTWRRYLDEHLPKLKVSSDWHEFKKLRNPKLLLIHYEYLNKYSLQLADYGFTFACVDEAQRIAKRTNKCSVAMGRLSSVPKRLVLTGTPQEVRETDYFGIFRFLQPEVFGDDWHAFYRRYFSWKIPLALRKGTVQPGTELYEILRMKEKVSKSKAPFKEEMRPEFLRKIKPYSIRLTKEDVGIKPSKVRKVVVPMSAKQKRCYFEMKNKGFTYLTPTRRTLAELAITNIAKQRQLATGLVFDDDEELFHLSDNKLEKVLELFKELPKPVVVFTTYRWENQIIYEELLDAGWDVMQVRGDTKRSERPKLWTNFQKAQYDGAVVQVKVGGVGVDMWKSDYAIVSSMSHSFRDWDQMKSRLDSRDKDEPSEFFILCSEGTIDEDLYDLVIVKRLNTELVLKRLSKGLPHGRKKGRVQVRRERSR